MFYNVPESAQKDYPDFFYSAFLAVCAQMVAYDTEWIEVDRNWDDAELFDYGFLFVASSWLHIVLRSFLRTL